MVISLSSFPFIGRLKLAHIVAAIGALNPFIKATPPEAVAYRIDTAVHLLLAWHVAGGGSPDDNLGLRLLLKKNRWGHPTGIDLHFRKGFLVWSAPFADKALIAGLTDILAPPGISLRSYRNVEAFPTHIPAGYAAGSNTLRKGCYAALSNHVRLRAATTLERINKGDTA